MLISVHRAVLDYKLERADQWVYLCTLPSAAGTHFHHHYHHHHHHYHHHTLLTADNRSQKRHKHEPRATERPPLKAGLMVLRGHFNILAFLVWLHYITISEPDWPKQACFCIFTIVINVIALWSVQTFTHDHINFPCLTKKGLCSYAKFLNGNTSAEPTS